MPRERVAAVAMVMAVVMAVVMVMVLGVVECRAWTCDQAALGAKKCGSIFCFIALLFAFSFAVIFTFERFLHQTCLSFVFCIYNSVLCRAFRTFSVELFDP